MKQFIKRFEQALLALDQIESKQILEEACQTMTPFEVAQRVVAPALEHIGDAWSNGRVALSQIYMCGRICERLIDEILPPAANTRKSQPNMAIATLQDYHMLGKNLVYSHLRSAGYELKDYGRMDISPLVERVVQDKIEVLMISTLMYPSALNIKLVCDQLKVVSPHTKVIVGGAPFVMDKELWKQVGADAMGNDAGSAITQIAMVWNDKEVTHD